MISTSSDTESQHASIWQLCLVFVLALLLFIAMRWQPEPWLQSKIAQQALQNGIDLQYQQLDIEGFSVRMEHVSIRTAALPAPVILDSLSISPAWSSLLTGVAAVDVKARLSGQSVTAVLAWQGKYIALHDLNAEFDVAALQTLWKQRMPLPVQIGGRVKLSGYIQIDAFSGFPADGQLDAVWQQASVDLPVFDKPLGDYQLALKAAAKAPGRWQWSLGGGAAVTLSGSGQLDLSGKSPQQWTINGRVQVQAGSEAKAIASLLGNQVKAFAISGNLLNARLQPM